MSNGAPIPTPGVIGSFAPYACVRCSKRKIKCERSLPTCPKCLEAESECVYLAPQPRRKRAARERTPVDRSTALGGHDASEPVPDHLPISSARSCSCASPSPLSPQIRPSAASTKRPRLEAAPLLTSRPGPETSSASSDGANELWSALGDARGREPTEPERREAPPDIGLEHIKLADPHANAMWGPAIFIDLAPHWPSSAVILSLWNSYLENFHPIVKIVNGPSVAKIVHASLESCTALSPAEQALLCCMFATSLYTLSDEICLSEHKEERSILLSRYRAMARHALSNANFLLSTNMMVLQAFVMLLISLRHTQESSSLWSLWGIAVRNGKRIGLDRFKATSHYTALENQERQCLWFNLIFMDAHVAEIAGAQRPWGEFRDHFCTPLNLDDDYLSPSSTETPVQKDGGTNATFTILRCDWVRGTERLGLQRDHKNTGRHTLLKTRLAAIDEIEQVLQRKYVHPCDPTIPSQFLIMLTAKQMIADWRLSAYRFKMDMNESDSAASQEISGKLVDLALKVLEYEYLAQSTSSLQIFAWHLQDRQPRQALILLLRELRSQTTGPQVDKAWLQIERCLVAHPVILRFDDQSWTWHLQSLILEAWEQREKARYRQQLAPIVLPHFLSQLRARRAGKIDATNTLLTPALSSTTGASWEVCGSSGISKVNGVPYMSDFDEFNDVTDTLDLLLDNALGPDRNFETESAPLLDWSLWSAPTGNTGFAGQLP